MGQRVVHFEIWGPNGGELQSFYSSLFGWNINANNPMNYGLTDTQGGEGGINGGIMGAQENGPPSGVTVYIEVPSIDEHLEQIEQNGGKVLMPRTEIPNMVTMAMFQDPAGNMVGLVEAMESAEAAPAQKKAQRKKVEAKVVKNEPVKKAGKKAAPAKAEAKAQPKAGKKAAAKAAPPAKGKKAAKKR